MAVTIHTEHDLNASPEAVWKVITDFERFPDWNPLHRRIELEGPFEPGTTIGISLQMDSFKSKHKAKLVVVDEGRREFGWVAQAGLVPGLVVVRRTFRVDARDGGGSRLVQDEVDSGLAVPLLFAGGLFERKIRRGYDRLVDAIERRAEASAPGGPGGAPTGLDSAARA
jgi:hypothetical protein